MPLVVVGSVAFDSVETPTQKRDNVLGGSAVFFCKDDLTQRFIQNIAGPWQHQPLVCIVVDQFMNFFHVTENRFADLHGTPPFILYNYKIKFIKIQSLRIIFFRPAGAGLVHIPFPRAEAGEKTGVACRAPGMTDTAAVPDKPVVGIRPVVTGNGPHEAG